MKWSLEDVKRQPVSVPFSRVQQVGGRREEFEFNPHAPDQVLLAPTVAIRNGMSSINIR